MEFVGGDVGAVEEDVLDVYGGVFGLEHEVDEVVSEVDVWGALGDGEVVDADEGTFFGVEDGDVGVFVHDAEEVAVVAVAEEEFGAGEAAGVLFTFKFAEVPFPADDCLCGFVDFFCAPAVGAVAEEF